VLEPTKVKYEASEYHFQVAPVPNVPPVCVNSVSSPTQIELADADNDDADVDGAFTVITTF
jgi:hypothetical protein